MSYKTDISETSTVILLTKYLSAAGLTLLLYDHLLTFSSEVSLVWKSPRSFSRSLFLFNRYVVPLGSILTASQMNGPTSFHQNCHVWVPSLATMALISLGIAEILVLLRVVVLWDRNPRVASLMILGFIGSFSATAIFMIIAIIKLIDHISYSRKTSICILDQTSPFLVATWSCPIIFECIVLVATAFNALSQPRTAQMPLTRALHRDGIIFFLALALLRMLNFGLSFNPHLTLISFFFVWPLISIILDRSLFRIREAKILDDKIHRENTLLGNMDPDSRPASPNGYSMKSRLTWAN